MTTNTELSILVAEIKTYLETKVPHLATKEDVLSLIDSHVEAKHKKAGLSNKHIGMIVTAGVTLLGALTAYLTGLV